MDKWGGNCRLTQRQLAILGLLAHGATTAEMCLNRMRRPPSPHDLKIVKRVLDQLHRLGLVDCIDVGIYIPSAQGRQVILLFDKNNDAGAIAAAVWGW